MSFNKKTILIILSSLFILNFIFTDRYPPVEADVKIQSWDAGTFKGKINDYIKLYFSDLSDEAYYYEWSTLVLGKKFEASYPLEKRQISRLKDLFYEPPRLRLPYKDIELEYPPTLILPLLGARLLSYDYMSFTKVLAALLSVAYLLSIYFTFQIWKSLKETQKLNWTTLLAFSGFFIVALGQLYVTRLDMFATLMILLSLRNFIQKKFISCAWWTALGGLTKGFPLLIAPIYGVSLIKEKKWKILAQAFAVLFFTLFGINFGLAWLTQGAYWKSFQYHSGRGIQLESLWASFLFLEHLIFHTPITIYYSHTSLNISGNSKDLFLFLTKLSEVFFLTLTYIIFYLKLKKEEGVNSLLLVRSSFLIVLIFLLFFKVLSPQYLIWLNPLLLLFSKRKLFPMLYGISCVFSQLIFPNFYGDLHHATLLGISLLFIRNFFLVLLFWAAFRDLLYIEKDYHENEK